MSGSQEVAERPSTGDALRRPIKAKVPYQQKEGGWALQLDDPVRVEGNRNAKGEVAIRKITLPTTRDVVETVLQQRRMVVLQGAAFCRDFCTAMTPNSCIQSLEFEYSPIELDEALPMSVAVSLCQVLEVLQLSHCSIADTTASKIVSILKLPGSKIHHVDLSGNTIGCVGAASFARAMREAKQLRTVNLAENLIADQGAAALAAGLAECPWINTVLVPANEIGDAGAAAFCNGVPKWVGLEGYDQKDELKRLNLEENRITPARKQALSDLLVKLDLHQVVLKL